MTLMEVFFCLPLLANYGFVGFRVSGKRRLGLGVEGSARQALRGMIEDCRLLWMARVLFIVPLVSRRKALGPELTPYRNSQSKALQ